jgi:glutathione reductase (NADPH)
MKNFDFDLFTLGAGSGGVRATRLAGESGARVAIAEESRIGGTCVIRGCVPKKHFVYAAEFAQSFADAAGYGWSVEWARFDWSKLRDNIQEEVGRLSDIYRANMEKANVAIFEERAIIEGPHTVRLLATNRTVTAERILVAAGGRPIALSGVKGAEYAITSDEAFLLDALPSQVLVLGGGYIAVEFATIFHGLGVETTLLYRGETILRGFDSDVRHHVQSNLKRIGVNIVTGAVVSEIGPIADGSSETYQVRLSNGMTLETGLIMAAIGRRPHTTGLGLETAGVRLKENGAIPVDAYSRTECPSIWAVGDVTDRINLTPIAIREGHAFADTEFRGRPSKVDHRDVPTAVFGRPPIGAVGFTEADARVQFGPVDIYKSTFRPMKHVVAGNDERTLMKIVVRASDDHVVGVHIAGADAPEMIQLAAIAVKAGITKRQWDETVALHPTAAEELVLMREKSQ